MIMRMRTSIRRQILYTEFVSEFMFSLSFSRVIFEG